jgi:hypothetical protein
MTLDQKLQLWMVIGTRVAGLATVGAVWTSLYLAGKSERLRLKVYAGIFLRFLGDGSPGQKDFVVNVTNLGERPVTITNVSFAIGKKRSRLLI